MFLKNIKTNLKVKLLVVLLATVSWVFVASNESLIGKYPNQITVNVSNLASEYTSFLDQEKVQIYLMAEPSVWGSLNNDSFSANVDVAGLKEGTYEIEVKVVSNVAGVQVTRVEPSKIFVNIEKLLTKNIPVNVLIEGDPSDGMVVGEVKLQPEIVQVVGPESLVSSLNEANVDIKLNGESSDLVRETKLYALSENGTKLDRVFFTPEKVSATVSIVKGGNNKTVGVKLNTKNILNNNSYISKVTITPPTVDVTGQRSALKDVYFVETEALDLSTFSENTTKILTLLLPAGVSLQKGTPSEVKVDIELAQSSVRSSVAPTVSYINLQTGLKVVSLEPEDIKIFVASTNSTQITPSNVKLEINLAGLGVGSHDLELTPLMVKPSSGIEILSILPTSIRVTLSSI